VAFIHAEAIADDALTASWVTPPPDDRPSTNRVNPTDYAFYWKARHRERESHEARTGGFYGDNSKRYQRNIAREFAARFNRKHLSRSISLLLVHANQKEAAHLRRAKRSRQLRRPLKPAARLGRLLTAGSYIPTLVDGGQSNKS